MRDLHGENCREALLLPVAVARRDGWTIGAAVFLQRSETSPSGPRTTNTKSLLFAHLTAHNFYFFPHRTRFSVVYSSRLDNSAGTPVRVVRSWLVPGLSSLSRACIPSTHRPMPEERGASPRKSHHPKGIRQARTPHDNECAIIRAPTQMPHRGQNAVVLIQQRRREGLCHGSATPNDRARKFVGASAIFDARYPDGDRCAGSAARRQA